MAGIGSMPGIGGELFGGGGGNPSAAPVQVGGGKNAVAQHLGSPHSGVKNTVTSGDPFSRSMGQYSKGHSFTSPLKQIRGGMGGMHRIRGGLGPGKAGQPGGATDYSMKTADTE